MNDSENWQYNWSNISTKQIKKKNDQTDNFFHKKIEGTIFLLLLKTFSPYFPNL